MRVIHLNIPASNQEISELKVGDIIILSGTVYTARDAAHKRIVESLQNGITPPFDIKDSAIFYTGPSPTKRGEIIGSCGPTSSSRMDDYTPFLLEHGLKIMIGKGKRNHLVVESIKHNKAVYLCGVGGAAVIIKQHIISSELIAYEDLGTEAVRKLTVKDLPLIVAIDSNGDKIFNV